MIHQVNGAAPDTSTATRGDSREVLLAKLAVAEAKLERANVHLQFAQQGHEIPVSIDGSGFDFPSALSAAHISALAPFPQQYTLSVSGICGNYTLHGLWPSTNNPIISKQQFTQDVFNSFPDNLKNFMNTYWPNCKNHDNMWFWNHEWTNHGNRYSSTHLTAQEFFQAVMDMYLPQMQNGFIQKNCNGHFTYNGPDCRLCYSQVKQGGQISYSSAGSC